MESGVRSSWPFWRGRQNLIFSDLAGQRKEFEFDSKCNGNLVKGFKKKNAGLDQHFKMLILLVAQQVIWNKQRRSRENNQLPEMCWLFGQKWLCRVGRFHAHCRTRKSLQDPVKVYRWRIVRREKTTQPLLLASITQWLEILFDDLGKTKGGAYVLRG